MRGHRPGLVILDELAHLEEVMPMPSPDIQHRFEYHPPQDEATKSRHGGIREGAYELAEEWDGLLPEGREKSLAITKLEEAMFWANAAIARHQ